jgi:hypothetical protein
MSTRYDRAEPRTSIYQVYSAVDIDLRATRSAVLVVALPSARSAARSAAVRHSSPCAARPTLCRVSSQTACSQ